MGCIALNMKRSLISTLTARHLRSRADRLRHQMKGKIAPIPSRWVILSANRPNRGGHGGCPAGVASTISCCSKSQGRARRGWPLDFIIARRGEGYTLKEPLVLRVGQAM